MRAVVLAVAVLFSVGVRAQALPWDAQYNPATRQTSISVSSTVPSRGVAANSPWGFSTAANGDVYASATGQVPGPLGPATTKAGAAVARSVAGRALAIAAKAIPVVALGGALWDLYKEYGASVGSSGAPTIWMPEGSFVYTWTYGNGQQFSSAGAALSSMQSYWQTAYGSSRQISGCYVNPGQTSSSLSASCNFKQWNANLNNGAGGWENETNTMGAGVVNAGAVQQSVEKPFELSEALQTSAQPNIAPALEQVAAWEPLPLNMPALKPEPASMPAPQATPWAATAADPAKQERAVYTPVWSEAEQAIKWNKTNEVKLPDGTVQSTPEDAPSAGAEAFDLCAEYPDSSACAKLGEASEPEPLPTKQTPVSITSWGAWGPSSGSCPQKSITFMGRLIEIDYTLVCSAMGMVRPLLLAMSGVVGVLIFMGAFKGKS